MPRPKGKRKDETDGNVLGACEYTVGGSECDATAVTQINGYALCTHHKKYGHNLTPRPNSAPNLPEDKDALIGNCEYPKENGEMCNKKANRQIEGVSLCDAHYDTFQSEMQQAAREGDDSADTPENTAKIEEQNKETEFRNARPSPGGFTQYSVLADVTALCDKVERNIKRVPKGRQIAAYLNSARLLLLDEMSTASSDIDPRQLSMPLRDEGGAPARATVASEPEVTGEQEQTTEPETAVDGGVDGEGEVKTGVAA